VSEASQATRASTPAQDPSHDVGRSEPHPLDAILVSHSIALIGATDRASDLGRAALVDDRDQGQGLGTELYRRLIAVARDEKLKRVVSTISGREPRDARNLPKACLPSGGGRGRRNRASRVGCVIRQ